MIWGHFAPNFAPATIAISPVARSGLNSPARRWLNLKMTSQRPLTLAIDFGTSNSLVGAARGPERIEALPIDPIAEDPTLMRTLIYFSDAKTVYFGHETLDRYLENEMEGRLFRSFKSHLANRNYQGTNIGSRVVTLENMITAFLIELKSRAERQLGEKATRAVIGKPARYSLDNEIDAFAFARMKKATEAAGFSEVQFVPEPLAAALDYRRQQKQEKLVLIGDFGGGTSDFTLLKIGPHPFADQDVIGLDGCPLAGDALDSLFMSQRLNIFFGAQAKYKMLMSSNWLTMPPTVMERLNQPAHIVHLKERATYEFIREVRKGALGAQEKAAIDRLFALIEDQQIYALFEKIEFCKRELSNQELSNFVFDYPGIDIACEFTRKDFEGWAQINVEKIFASMDSCLRQGGVTPEQVDLVSLTGGTSRVPRIRNEFIRRFGAAKLQSQTQFHSVLSGLIEFATHWR